MTIRNSAFRRRNNSASRRNDSASRWKKGQADGVHIYVDRHDGNGFVLLARTVKTQYLDTAALPANTFSVTWEYKIRYLFGDDEVGQFSQAISVNVIKSV